MRGQTNNIFKDDGRDSRESRNKSELDRAKSKTIFRWAEKVETYRKWSKSRNVPKLGQLKILKTSFNKVM